MLALDYDDSGIQQNRKNGAELSYSSCFWRATALLGMLFCLWDILALRNDASVINKIISSMINSSILETNVINTFGSPRAALWLIVVFTVLSGITEIIRLYATRWHLSDVEVVKFLREVERYNTGTLLLSLSMNSHKSLVKIVLVVSIMSGILFSIEILQFSSQLYQLVSSFSSETVGSALISKPYLTPIVGAAFFTIILLSLPYKHLPKYIAGVDEIPATSYGIVEVPRGIFCITVDREHRERTVQIIKNNFYKPYWESVHAFAAGHVISSVEKSDNIKLNAIEITIKVGNLRFAEDPDSIQVQNVVEPTNTLSIGNYHNLSCSEPETLLKTALSESREVLKEVVGDIARSVTTAITKTLESIVVRNSVPDSAPYETIKMKAELYRHIDEVKEEFNTKHFSREKSIFGGMYTYKAEIESISIARSIEEIIEKIAEEARRDKDFGNSLIQSCVGILENSPELILLNDAAGERLLQLFGAARGSAAVKPLQLIQGTLSPPDDDNQSTE